MFKWNLLQKTITNEKPLELDKLTTYKYILSIIDVNNSLSFNEKELLAFIMAQGSKYNITKRGETKVASEVLGVSTAQVSNYKTRLQKKSLLDEEGVLVSNLNHLVDKLPNELLIYLPIHVT